MRDGIDFKMVDGKVKIATEQVVDVDEFERRIVSIATKKLNFGIQLEFLKNQIEEANHNIPQVEQNIKAATEDIEEAINFLRLNHREDIIKKIEEKITEQKNKLDEQTKKQDVVQ